MIKKRFIQMRGTASEGTHDRQVNVGASGFLPPKFCQSQIFAGHGVFQDDSNVLKLVLMRNSVNVLEISKLNTLGRYIARYLNYISTKLVFFLKEGKDLFAFYKVVSQQTFIKPLLGSQALREL